MYMIYILRYLIEIPNFFLPIAVRKSQPDAQKRR